MTTFLSGRRHEIPKALFDELCRYRHEIFVRNLGWSLPSWGEEGIELDEFDGTDALYVIALREDETVCGTARLLPTTRPYLLEALFPDLVPALPRRSPAAPRRSLSVWELSRFAVSPEAALVTRTTTRLSAAVFAESVHVARAAGAKIVVGAVSRALERLLRVLGLRIERLGADRMLEGEVVVPCALEIDAHEAWLDGRLSDCSPPNLLPRTLLRRREGERHVAIHSGSVVCSSNHSE
jgi:acyl homoserine lactone synthase